MRGEVWWAKLNGQQPVVLLSGIDVSEISALIVVEPAAGDVAGICIELPVGEGDGLHPEGVVRVALPRGGVIPCQWLVTLRAGDLTRRTGALSADKCRELARMTKLAGIE